MGPCVCVGHGLLDDICLRVCLLVGIGGFGFILTDFQGDFFQMHVSINYL